MAEKVTHAARTARGVLFVHSSPRALCPHVEWAAGRALGTAVNFDWSEQPVYRGLLRAEFYWEGETGTGAKLASALRGCQAGAGRCYDLSLVGAAPAAARCHGDFGCRC